MYPMTNTQIATVLLLVLSTFGLLDSTYGGIIILSPQMPDNSSYPMIIAQAVEFSTMDFNITAPVILVESTGCEGFDFDGTGSILYVAVREGCSVQRRLYHAQQINALAVIVAGSEQLAGRDVRLPSEDQSGPFTVPGVYIALNDTFFLQLLRNSTTVTIQMTPDSNPWTEFYDSAGCIAYQAIFIAVFAALLSISIWKIVEATKANGLQFTILQAFIGIEMLNNIMRLIYFVDPFRSRGLYPLPASFILETLHIPLTFCGSMLITLYWLETVSDYISSKPSAKWLGKMSAPFYVFLALVIGLFAVFLGLGYIGNQNFLIVIIVVWVLFGISAVFLIAVGAKVLSFARKMSRSLGNNSSRNSAVKLMTVKIIFVALGMLLILALYPAILTNYRWDALQRQFGGNVVVFSTLAIVSTAQLLTIQRKRPSKSWKTSSSAKTNNTQQTPTATEEPLPTV